MSITANLCCDETEARSIHLPPRSIHSPDILKEIKVRSEVSTQIFMISNQIAKVGLRKLFK